MTQITLLETFSACAQQTEIDALGLAPPNRWRLSTHQIETYKALQQAHPGEVIFNTALTGDGKSLAGHLPFLRALNGIPKSLLMFPTKELGHDQLLQLERNTKIWMPNEDRQPKLLDADELTGTSAKRDLSRPEALRSTLADGDFVLTNPDILHYIMQACYTRPQAEAPDRVIGQLVNSFSQLTFDEFHIFESPQVVAVTNVLLLIRALTGSRCPRFLFLSATPNQLMVEYFQKADIPCRVISGTYAHGPISDQTNWRRILRQATLHVQSMTTTEWISAHLEDVLLKFFVQHGKQAKGAIIVNSVAMAQSLFNRLTSNPAFIQYGIRVGLNTGFDTKSARQQSYDADLLIGTSTVDVGVDFRINFLLFESRDAGTFLQRLGRLGRHDSYEADGKVFTFNTFEAHALVPEWVHQSFFIGQDNQPPMLTEGQKVDRETLRDCVRRAFRESNPFNSYGKYWGGLQAAKICAILSSPLIRDTYADTRKTLILQYEQVLGIQMGAQARRLKLLQEEQKPLADEALSFRGSTLFEAGVIDDRLPSNELRVKRYDLLWLLTNMNVQFCTKQEFENAALHEGWDRATLDRLNLLTYLRCLSQRDERLPIEFLVGHDLQNHETDWFHTAKVLDGIEIFAQGVPGLNAINRVLAKKTLPVLLSLKSPYELARRFRLPPLFRLFPMHGRGGNVRGTIAFGRQALMLDVVLRGRRDLLPPQSALIW